MASSLPLSQRPMGYQAVASSPAPSFTLNPSYGRGAPNTAVASSGPSSRNALQILSAIDQKQEEIDNHVHKASTLALVVFWIFFLIELGLAITEVMLGFLWFHLYGVLLACIFMMVLALKVGLARPRSYKGKRNKTYKIRAIVIYVVDVLFCLVIIGFVVVHIIGKDVKWTTLPSSCPEAASENCAHLGLNSYRVSGFESGPLMNVSTVEIMRVVRHWAKNEPRTTILRNTPTFLHARILSNFFGFPDDFGVEIKCDNTTAFVSLHSQSRLTGGNDLGVNGNRIKAVIGKILDESYTTTYCSQSISVVK